MTSSTDLPWAHCFVDPDDPARPAEVLLRQVTRRCFELESSLLYTGRTGVPDLPAEAVLLRPRDLGERHRTDLTSVPAPLTWLVSPYGVHTPAALLHDRLIGRPGLAGVSDVQADRFFRFMLRELGVRWLRRWLMWSAVALGSRWRAGGLRRVSVVLWVLLSGTGMVLFGVGAVRGSWGLATAAALAPVPAALLWGRQYKAGLIAALSALWVLPPTVFGAAGFWVYAGLERLISLLTRSEAREPIRRGPF